MELTIKQIQFCAEECERQQTGPLAVPDMCRAYSYAVHYPYPRTRLDGEFIRVLGLMVDPENRRYRTTPATFKGGTVHAIPASQVPRQMDLLIDAFVNGHKDGEPRIGAGEFVKTFLDIHPFKDGNGRTAAIMWNWIRGTLGDPSTFPDFYGDGG